MRSFTLVLLVVMLAGCTFERRPDRASNGDGDGAYSLAPEGEARVLQPADSVLLVAQLYREALEVGDLSRALSFLHPGAALYNDAAALLPANASAGEVLLQELRLRQEGLRLEVVDSEATILGDAALVLKRYRVSEAGAVAASDDEGDSDSSALESETALETIILVRSPTGWRIRHLHRSAVATP